MPDWKPRNNKGYQSVLEYLMDTSGMTEQEILRPAKIQAGDICNISEAAGIISFVVNRRDPMPVYIIGDYDADGITSASILSLLFSYYDITPEIRIPGRFTDGYGINENLIADIRNSLIICVDNGITATEVIDQANAQGNVVIVLDHHLSNTIPNAYVVVDPHVTGNSAFTEYCGAGLALKLAEYLLPDMSQHRNLFYPMTALACIGTIADVVPLVSDNRRIVMDGLKIINNQSAFSSFPIGLQEILRLAEFPINEETIKFTIAPILNAAGRMYDKGSLSTVKAILCTDAQQAAIYAQKLKEINEERKKAVSVWTEKAKTFVEPDACCQVLYLPKAPEGIMGIIAGKIAEKMLVPAIVLTDSREEGVLKGSGRAPDGFHLYDAITHVKDLTLAAGGHEGAAGLSVAASHYESFKSTIQSYASECGFHASNALYYDMELDEKDAYERMVEIRKYGPYGAGCERPVFCMRSFHRIEKYGYEYRLLGSNQNHLKLFGTKMDVIGFGLGSDYEELGAPETVSMIGNLGTNTYNGKTTLQFEAAEIGIM